MIQIENLNFSYQKENLLKQISTTFESGNIYGLLGENGVGKSTLLKLIAGLIFPNAGNINVGQHTPSKRMPSFLSDTYLLSEPIANSNLKGKDYISIKAPFYPNFDHQKLHKCINSFGLTLDQNLNTFSHGQQKKFFLSFSLSCNTQYLMLDEPTNGLDISSISIFKKLIAESVNEEQIVIISTHQVPDIESLVDAIVILKNGSILLNKRLDEISQAMRMSITKTRPETQDNLLYSDAKTGHFANLWKDDSAPDGQIDLELLFKALNSIDSETRLFSQNMSSNIDLDQLFTSTSFRGQ